MNTTRPWRWHCLAGLGLALSTLSGCQTWVGGMTLPSGHYLQHPPQYFPPSPPFPLSRELSSMEAAEAAAAGSNAPLRAESVPAPAPLQAAPAPGPGPIPAIPPGVPPGPPAPVQPR